MATRYNSKIVTDGLVLALDAGNHISYPGSGTTWTDLSGQSSNGTLTNGPTFDSGNGGGIVFDGVNDFVRVSSFNSDNSSDALSVFCWVYPTNLTNYTSSGIFFNWIINKRVGNSSPRDWQFLSRNSKLSVQIYDQSDNDIGSHIADNGVFTLQLNQWQYIGFTTSGLNGGNLNTYYNGQLNLQATLSGNRSKKTMNMDIGKTGWANDLYWTGKISNISIYNSNLTLSQILQNYNATKSRFGL
jgi:hypothetical protein